MEEACCSGDLCAVKVAIWKAFQEARRYVKTRNYANALGYFQREVSAGIIDACLGGHTHILEWLCPQKQLQDARFLRDCVAYASQHKHTHMLCWTLRRYVAAMNAHTPEFEMVHDAFACAAECKDEVSILQILYKYGSNMDMARCLDYLVYCDLFHIVRACRYTVWKHGVIDIDCDLFERALCTLFRRGKITDAEWLWDEDAEAYKPGFVSTSFYDFIKRLRVQAKVWSTRKAWIAAVIRAAR